MPGFDVVGVNMVATILSLTIWGFYSCLFITTLRVLRLKNVSFLSKPALVLILIFICNAVDSACVSYEAYRAFIIYPTGPAAYYNSYALHAADNLFYTADDACLAIAAYFGELLMVWRLYVIWSRNRRVLYLPAVLATLGAVGCILIIVYDVLGGRWATDPGFMVQYKMISVAVFAITIVATWYSTILICYRLYLVDREMHALRETGPGSPSHRYARIMRVLVQSGLLYSVTLGAWLIATVTGNTSAQDMIRYLNIRAVGLNSTLIMLQLSLRSRHTTAISDTGNQSHTALSDVQRLPMHHKNQMVDIGMRTIDMDQPKVSIGELPPEPQLSPSAVHLDRIRQESSTQIEEMA